MAGDRASPDRRHKRQYHTLVLARALPAGRRGVCAGPRSAFRPQRLQLFEAQGTVREALPGEAADAQRVLNDLGAAAIDFGDVARVLEAEGIEKSAPSFETLLGVIAAKRKTLVAAAPPRHSAELRAFDPAGARRLGELEGGAAAQRGWGPAPACRQA